MTATVTYAASFLLAVIGVARATRLLTSDAWPPAAAARIWWINQTKVKGGWRADWSVLATCPFCASPYLAAPAVAAAVATGVWPVDLSSWAAWWWLIAAWASISYLASMLVLRDEPE